jgi:thiol-disulfide isomerase/thioredoxin
MKRLIVLFFMMISVAHIAIADTGNLKPYQRGDWSSLLKAGRGAPMVVHFWGVTCTPCAKEMPQWGKFVAANKNANVIFVQVDDVSPEMIQKMLNKTNLAQANNYYVNSSFDEQLRYEVDPKWRGETPITILIDKNGKAIRKTGLINFPQLQSWLSS